MTTQLAEKGARTQTIMKILGHESAGMSMIYANISDPAVLADYQSVLQPGAVIAGPLAETLRAVQLGQDALNWLKTNFYKTELELGHCLRLQEGPCECDLYPTCAKLVTTPHYAPRLRERLCLERQLADDARQRGWDREIERDQRIANRIGTLLTELGEPAAQEGRPASVRRLLAHGADPNLRDPEHHRTPLEWCQPAYVHRHSPAHDEVDAILRPLTRNDTPGNLP